MRIPNFLRWIVEKVVGLVRPLRPEDEPEPIGARLVPGWSTRLDLAEEFEPSLPALRAATASLEFPAMTIQRLGPPRFEYTTRTLPLGTKDVENALNPLGADGWDVVGVLRVGSNGSTVLLRRPLVEPEPELIFNPRLEGDEV